MEDKKNRIFTDESIEGLTEQYRQQRHTTLKMLRNGFDLLRDLDAHFLKYTKYINNYFYNCTGYPYIFKNTYWGRFVYRYDSHFCKNFDDIIRNRNEFIKKYNIKKIANKCPVWVRKHYIKDLRYLSYQDKFDHVEVYQTYYNSYVIVSSPYNDDDEYYNNLGFTKYAKLYSMLSCTYIKEIKQK
jgi:hypothetical protein